MSASAESAIFMQSMNLIYTSILSWTPRKCLFEPRAFLNAIWWWLRELNPFSPMGALFSLQCGPTIRESSSFTNKAPDLTSVFTTRY